MYRDYEDLYVLEQQLKSLEHHLIRHPEDVDAQQDLQEIKDILNSADQDEEVIYE